jgi:hypothetical protein
MHIDWSWFEGKPISLKPVSCKAEPFVPCVVLLCMLSEKREMMRTLAIKIRGGGVAVYSHDDKQFIALRR